MRDLLEGWGYGFTACHGNLRAPVYHLRTQVDERNGAAGYSAWRSISGCKVHIAVLIHESRLGAQR
jgi:hypothetical protein